MMRIISAKNAKMIKILDFADARKKKKKSWDVFGPGALCCKSRYRGLESGQSATHASRCIHSQTIIMSADSSLSTHVTLISSDGYEFIILREAAYVAGTIKKMLDPTSLSPDGLSFVRKRSSLGRH